MLSVFPNLFTYGLAAPLIIRLTLGAYFILQGMRRHKEDREAWDALWDKKKLGPRQVSDYLSRIQMVIGIFLVIGLYTQVAAILAILFAWAEWYKRTKQSGLSFQEIWIMTFVTATGFSLLFLGAGFLAFDLPL